MPYRGMLDETGFVTLDGSGNGTARIGPLTAREIWYPANASVKTEFLTGQTAPVKESQCQIFVGQTATSDNFRDNTFSGSSGDSSGKVAGKPVKKGDYIFAVWTAGDAGVRAQLNVTGEKDV